MQSLLPDQRRSFQDRYTLFMMIILGIIMIQMWTASNRQQERAEQQRRQRQQQDVLNEPIVEKEKKTSESKSDEPEAEVAETEAQPAWLSLGSMDPKSPYRMLVTLTNQGAAVARVELNTPNYRDVQEHSGYLGQIVVDTMECDKERNGVVIQAAGPGTPAHRFGLAVGDRIIRFNRKPKGTEGVVTTEIKQFEDLRNCLLKTKPGEHIDLKVVRGNREIDLTVVLGHHPMDVIRPESVPYNYDDYRHLGALRGAVLKPEGDRKQSDQLSFLTTFRQIDDQKLELPKSFNANNSKMKGIISRDRTLDGELTDVALRKEPWEIVSSSENEAVFRRTVPARKLEMTKTYRLEKIETPENQTPSVGAGYRLTLKIAVRNLDNKERRVAYQLDGPTGLPLEGGWYARKTGPGWGVYGIRDIVVRFKDAQSQVFSNNVVGTDKVDRLWIDDPLDYIGVDSLYFQCTLKPNRASNEAAWHANSLPIRVGERNADWSILTDVTYRLMGREITLQPGDGPESRIEHEYSIFVGPKDTRILDEYKLGETISYGWFWFVAQPLLGVLHFFHSLGLNYAMAIIALTVCVRLLMFPISRKQAQGAVKMAQIQPELQAINEKYKDDMQARSAATSAVFKKHNYHPASGCLPLFIQLPIFIGLYKALSIDAGLYGTPLITPALRWCSDLSAPDMLFDWSSFWTSIGWPGFNTGQGMLALGPYFNLLPMLTIVLFLVQQAVMMPPPTDDQSRMQRKMMQYMMLFMGLLFFKIPSGLCIYFIASTLWGLAERRFVPKPAPNPVGGETYDVSARDPKHSKEKKKGAKETRSPEKKEGFFGKLMKEVAEKAAEQRKLEKAAKKDNKKKR